MREYHENRDANLDSFIRVFGSWDEISSLIERERERERNEGSYEISTSQLFESWPKFLRQTGNITGVGNYSDAVLNEES